MKSLFLMIASLLVCASATSAREFTDAQGRKIEADLVSHSGSTVVIDRGGKEFAVEVTMFSLDDQNYIRKWIEENPDAVNYEFNYYVDLEKLKISQQDADGGASEDKLKTIPYNYEMIVFNKGIAPAEDIEIRSEIYIEDFVDVRKNRFVRMATGGEKRARNQTIAGKLDPITIPASGRHDFERTVNTEFYIDRDGGRTDEAATDKMIGVRIRIYKNGKVLDEYEDGEDDRKMAEIKWQDTLASDGPGPSD